MLALETTVAIVGLEPASREDRTRWRAQWNVPRGWRQGRGAWGGLVVTAVVRAALSVEPGPRAVRAVTAQILAPIPSGIVEVEITELRRGSATATWQVRLIDPAAAGVAVQAVVVLGDARALGVDEELSRPDRDAQMPAVAPWADTDLVPVAAPLGPEFAAHLLYRPISGFPYSGTDDDIACWVSYPQGTMDEAALLGLVDALWPLAVVRLDHVRPMATINFTASLLVDPASLDPGEPILHTSRSMGSYAGYSTEHRQLWSSDGRLLVDNPQVIAIIR
jgi:hypothetical protein